MSAKKIYPADLLRWTQDEDWQDGPISLDTETSGLWVDAGARVSTVSVAWALDDDRVAHWAQKLGAEGVDQYQWDDGIWTLRRETGAGARSGDWTRGDWTHEHWVLSMAWPFDQGALGTGKPEDKTSEIVAAGRGGMLGDLDGWEPDRPPADSGNLGAEQWEALTQWVERVGSEAGLVMHNAKFDIHLMNAGTRWSEGGVDLLELVIWDTQGGADLWTGWRTSDIGKPTTSLKPTSAWLWGGHEDDEKRVISQYLKKNKLPSGRWDLMPWPVIAKYADQDARLTIRLYLWQKHERERVARAAGIAGTPERGWYAGGGVEGFERRMETMRMLTRVERRGLPFDVAGAREASVELGRRSSELEEVLAETLGGKVTLPMAKHYWFGKGDKMGEKGRDVRGLGLEPYALTDTGEPVVDIATMARMLRDEVPLAKEWQAYKKLQDARGMWYDGWANRAGADGRLRPGFRQNGTASGRFSVENLQLQSIPADYRVRGVLDGIPSPRDLIGAGVPDGFELWEMDLAQAELRVAAYMAECGRMLDLIEKGEDLHGSTAEALFGLKPGDEGWGAARQVAKRGNFSLIFGVGWRTFQETLWKEAQVEMAEPEVRKLITDWNALYPEYRQAIKRHESRVLERYNKHGIGWIGVGAGGERRWFTKWDIEYFDPETGRHTKSAHKAFNQRVQPSLAQYGIDLWLDAERMLRDEYGDGQAGLCLMVHDSMVLLLPKGDGERITERIRQRGRELWEQWFPGLPGDLDATRWAEHA